MPLWRRNGQSDIRKQVDARLERVEDDVRRLRDEMTGRFGRVDGRFGQLRSEMNGRLGGPRTESARFLDEMHRRFDQVERLAVAILLVEVIGFGRLWLK